MSHKAAETSCWMALGIEIHLRLRK